MIFNRPMFSTASFVISCLLLLSMSLTARATSMTTAETTPESMAFIAQNSNEPVEKRVQALHFISQHPNQNSLVAVARALKDEHALIRQAAIAGASPYPLKHRYRMVSPLLNDPVQSVRGDALVYLLKDYDLLAMDEQAQLTQHADKLVMQLSDKKSYSEQLLLADIYRLTFRFEASQHLYKNLLESEQKNATLFLNASLNYHALGDEHNALSILEQGINFDNQNAALYYAQALALVRLEQKGRAAIAMQKATQFSPENAYYWYLNGVLQEPIDTELAINSFKHAYLVSGSAENLYALCDIYARNKHQDSEQCINTLADIAPPEVIDDLHEKLLN
ncbi:hypothetical protein CW745_03505 [Psychromonas sp. psych-6C06]|uniref:tetratricopeptide repeat protein n=1 Tax=Psychromonas sp. psych-6C06 TaxID=2058089 RepID=UPI000C34D768|nr:hypothetical protein [Psychromonas sp. psych-6C06]PKF62512.1 hypothetical protein CW745_03505 [Psychromonas sp. psych-6C06]